MEFAKIYPMGEATRRLDEWRIPRHQPCEDMLHAWNPEGALVPRRVLG